MIIKTTIVPKQPPPNFLAPYPDIKPRNKLFILTLNLLNYKNCYNLIKGRDFSEKESYTILRMCYNIPTFGGGGEN
jgi:hypothetical protein